MKRRAVRLRFAACALMLSCGCAVAGANDPPIYLSRVDFNVSAKAAERAAYYDSLRVCRLQQPGRLSRKMHLPPTQTNVARCLRGRG